MPSDRERIATLEEAKKNTARAIDAIFLYMREGSLWREETGKSLVRLLQSQEAMAAYQVRCDADRDNIQHDANGLEKRQTAAENRIADTEKFQRRQIKVAIFSGLLIGGAGAGGAKLPDVVTKIIAWFS